MEDNCSKVISFGFITCLERMQQLKPVGSKTLMLLQHPVSICFHSPSWFAYLCMHFMLTKLTQVTPPNHGLPERLRPANFLLL
jgi:uncharacterized membrane protein YesL